MKKLPHMAKVQHGTEFEVDGLPTWDCKAPAADCYKALLDCMGKHMLVGSSKEGIHAYQLQSGLDQFKRPQTSDSASNMQDSHCHMPSHESFHQDLPFNKSQFTTSWYTQVKLGRDKTGAIIKERAHVIIAAARFGVPNSKFRKTLPFGKVHQALHCACCPHDHGGCNNPLHIRWGKIAENLQDQLDKQTSMLQGTLARGSASQAEGDEPTPRHVEVVLAPRRVTRSQHAAQQVTL